MGYQVQLTELQYKIERMQKAHLDEVDKIKWEMNAELKAKDIQLEAIKKAQTLMQHRLKQAEDAINEYMAHPIIDPTTEIRKYSHIKKLAE